MYSSTFLSDPTKCLSLQLNTTARWSSTPDNLGHIGHWVDKKWAKVCSGLKTSFECKHYASETWQPIPLEKKVKGKNLCKTKSRHTTFWEMCFFWLIFYFFVCLCNIFKNRILTNHTRLAWQNNLSCLSALFPHCLLPGQMSGGEILNTCLLVFGELKVPWQLRQFWVSRLNRPGNWKWWTVPSRVGIKR